MKGKSIVIIGFSFFSACVFAQPATNARTTTPASIPSTPLPTQTQPLTTVNVSAENKKAGEIFLYDNKSVPGVIITASGLQYKIMQNGAGPKPKLNDTVIVNYEGKHLNGQIFDSSYQQGKPKELLVSNQIPGLKEALQMMNKGATWEIYIPANLAYGEHSYNSTISANETLIFKVHLIEIIPPPSNTPIK